MRSLNESGRTIRRTHHVDLSGLFRSSQLDRSTPNLRPRCYRDPQASDASYRRSQRLILIVHDSGSRFAACVDASRSQSMHASMHRLIQLESATAGLSTKESTSHSTNVAVQPVRRDRFLARLERLEGLSHYRRPQPRAFAIDEHSSCIRCEAATAVLVVRNSASGSGARRREGCRRVCILPRSRSTMLARRRAGTRVESSCEQKTLAHGSLTQL